MWVNVRGLGNRLAIPLMSLCYCLLRYALPSSKFGLVMIQAELDFVSKGKKQETVWWNLSVKRCHLFSLPLIYNWSVLRMMQDYEWVGRSVLRDQLGAWHWMVGMQVDATIISKELTKRFSGQVHMRMLFTRLWSAWFTGLWTWINLSFEPSAAIVWN